MVFCLKPTSPMQYAYLVNDEKWVKESQFLSLFSLSGITHLPLPSDAYHVPVFCTCTILPYFVIFLNTAYAEINLLPVSELPSSAEQLRAHVVSCLVPQYWLAPSPHRMWSCWRSQQSLQPSCTQLEVSALFYSLFICSFPSSVLHMCLFRLLSVTWVMLDLLSWQCKYDIKANCAPYAFLLPFQLPGELCW